MVLQRTKVYTIVDHKLSVFSGQGPASEFDEVAAVWSQHFPSPFNANRWPAARSDGNDRVPLTLATNPLPP